MSSLTLFESIEQEGVTPLEMNGKIISRATVAESQTPWYLYNFVKSYLYLLSNGQCTDVQRQLFLPVSDNYFYR